MSTAQSARSVARSRCSPDSTHAHWNLALALLLDGQYAEGWREYESRFALSELGKDRHAFAGPAWDGSAPKGKTLLLYTEQGLGDALQFARFVAPLARTGARCIVHCPPALAPLLATAPGVAQTVTDADRLPRYDAHLPLLSLPRLLGTTVDAIPADVPYITVAPERRAAARKLIAASPRRLRVGLVWTGNPANPSNRIRSAALDALDPLFEVEGIDWYSLQQGRTAADFTAAARNARMRPLARRLRAGRHRRADRRARSGDQRVHQHRPSVRGAGPTLPGRCSPSPPTGAGCRAAPTAPGTRRCVCSGSRVRATGTPWRERSPSSCARWSAAPAASRPMSGRRPRAERG